MKLCGRRKSNSAFRRIFFEGKPKVSDPLRPSLGSLEPSLNLHTNNVGGENLLTVIWWQQRGCRPRTGMSPWAPPAQLHGTWSRHVLRALLQPQSSYTCTQAQGEPYICPKVVPPRETRKRMVRFWKTRKQWDRPQGLRECKSRSEQGPQEKKMLLPLKTSSGQGDLEAWD